MPLQSGSDRILEKMKRGYTVADYRDAAERLRKSIPDMAITTDIIVGFPSESEEDFNLTREFMEEIRFDNAFIFKYSSRSGTKAAEMDDDVSAEEKMRRNKVLLEDQDKRGLDINNSLVGRDLDVLVEGVSLRDASRWAGRTTSNKIAVFEPVDGLSAGDIINVKISRAMPQTLYGEIYNRHSESAN
jgi:tRNA-2-methylthio-N6-dimethylallyladenosine synthase